MSANTITKAIVTYLNLNNCYVWRQNNVGIYDQKTGRYRRNPNNKKGVADIIGIKSDGTFIAIEVKYGKDKLSQDQKIFLENIDNHNGEHYVVKSFDDFLEQYENV